MPVILAISSIIGLAPIRIRFGSFVEGVRRDKDGRELCDILNRRGRVRFFPWETVGRSAKVDGIS